MGIAKERAAMIKVKHFLDAIEKDDGQRIWVEPIGLTKDLVEMCSIAHVLTHLGPAMKLWNWLEQHPDGYDYFRAQYHEQLAKSAYRPRCSSWPAPRCGRPSR